jgi:HD-like signal output (HDOD) protein/CheY-like chemotaxis protein
MANVLYLDDDELAISVLSTVLKRRGDSLTVAKSAEEAWALLCKGVFYDILFLEIKLESGDASSIVAQIKENPYLKKLPIIVYTKEKKKEAVKKMTDLDVTNYLMKPFRDALLKEEIDKAMQVDWRIVISGNSDDFYKQANENIDAYYRQNEKTTKRMVDINAQIIVQKDVADLLAIKDEISIVIQSAEKAGFITYSNMLARMLKLAVDGKWSDIQLLLKFLPHAEVLQEYRMAVLEVYSQPDGEALEEAPLVEGTEAAVGEAESEVVGEKSHGFTRMQIEEKVRKVIDYPVIESAAAQFAMIVNDEEVLLDDIVAIVGEDSGLATSVLKFSNSPIVAASSPSEDIKRAVAVIGVKRVRTLATSLRTISEVAPMFTAFKWQDFWMHQLGCALLSEYIFEELRLPGRSEIAYLGGLIHDIGKILLCEIDPEGYAGVVAEATNSKRPLASCETDYFSISFSEVGSIFAESSELPDVIKIVMAHGESPESAIEYADLVGTISIANYLCIKYQVGDSGDRHIPHYNSLTDHPSWKIIERWIPPSFNSYKFVEGVERKIFKLKSDLAGIINDKK